MANAGRAAERRGRRRGSARPAATGATSSPRPSTASTSRAADHAFLDAAWSHVDELRGRQAGARAERALPGGGLEAAARRVHGHDAALRRRPPAAAHAARSAVPRGGRALQRRGHPGRGAARAAATSSTLDPAGAAIAYLDPPYAPPRDDTCYVKRYHFLEGLATYWRGQEIMWETRTRKLRKRHTPFGSKRTARVRAGPPVRPFRRPRGARRVLRLQRRCSTPRSSRRCSPGTGAACGGSRSPPVRVRHPPPPRSGDAPPSTCSSADNPRAYTPAGAGDGDLRRELRHGRQAADRAAEGRRHEQVPADLDRASRGGGHPDEAAGGVDSASDDARPPVRHARGARGRVHARLGDRAAREHVLRVDHVVSERTRGRDRFAAQPTRSRWRCAPARRSSPPRT